VAEFSNFSNGNKMMSFVSPSYPIANVIISSFFRHRLSFFMNRSGLANYLVPEIVANASFYFNYDPADFLYRIEKKLSQLPAKSQLVIIHTCAAHWPGQSPYPYYLKGKDIEAPGNKFSYTNKSFNQNFSNFTTEDWQARAKRNQALYEGGFEYLIREFLNPFMDQLVKFNYFDFSTSQPSQNLLGIISDHGENLYKTDRFFPTSRVPNHGGSLLFSSRSEQTLNRFYPANFFENTPDPMSTTAILPFIYNKVFEKQIPVPNVLYTEVGIWPLVSFQNQFLINNIFQLAPLFQFDRASGTIYINDLFLPTIIVQKQRAAYDSKHRLTYYPTTQGPQWFLCRFGEDENCEQNLIESKKVDKKTLNDLRQIIDDSLVTDIQDKNMIDMDCIKSNLNPENYEEEQAGLYYYKSTSCLNLTFNLAQYYQSLNVILQKTNSGSLKEKIMNDLLSHCSKFDFFGLSSFVPNFKNIYFEPSYLGKRNLNCFPDQRYLTTNNEKFFSSILNFFDLTQIASKNPELQNISDLRQKIFNLMPLTEYEKKIVLTSKLESSIPNLESLLLLGDGNLTEFLKRNSDRMNLARQHGFLNEIRNEYWYLANFYARNDQIFYSEFMNDLLKLPWDFESFSHFANHYAWRVQKTDKLFRAFFEQCLQQKQTDCRSRAQEYLQKLTPKRRT
ncbi:MAG: hypothetical protein ACK5P5_03100, partial [Pseudobdellovibrionaceae bacterium]